jgi:hypothetical protein
MHLSTALSIRPRAPAPGEGPTADLLVDGRPAARIVPGAVLELAVVVAGRHLLFLADDVPFEEVLTVLLLGADLRPLDSASIGRAYQAGMFGQPRLIAPRRVEFAFSGDGTWAVEVLDAPRLRIPFVPEAPGVSRPFGLRRHFIISLTPGAPR